MRLLVDGHEATVTFGRETPLSTLMAHLASTLAQHQLLVAGVEVDGSPYQPEVHAHVTPDTLQRVEVVTESFADVSARLSAVASELVETLVDACKLAAGDLQSGYETRGLQLVEGTASSLEVLSDLVAQLQVVDPPRTTGWAAIAATLPGITTSLEHRDTVGLADILAYELRPALKTWLQALSPNRPGKGADRLE